ncbi:MAG: hypothetical protein JWQ19_1297 [Subtercola sp.]|nr:hypothetical protein [Subtercola sp.]
MTAKTLTVSHLEAWYGTAQALFGIDIAVAEREVVGLLGRNGAGKSTTFKAIMGIEARRLGTIVFQDREISRLRTETIARSGVAWVPPDRRIFPALSVRENLALAARARRQPLDVDRLVDAVPILERLLPRRGYQLSGGEKQAVAIARALAGKPRLLLLDEPTEGLSPLVVQQLHESILSLPAKFDVSIILAEQNLQFVLSLTSRVYVLDTGRMAHEGSSTEFANSTGLQHQLLSVASTSDSRSHADH